MSPYPTKRIPAVQVNNGTLVAQDQIDPKTCNITPYVFLIAFLTKNTLGMGYNIAIARMTTNFNADSLNQKPNHLLESDAAS